MAIQFIPILKALAPIVANAGAAAAALAGMQKSENRKCEEKVAQLAAIAADLAKKTQAIAEQLRAQAALNEVLQKRIKICLVLSLAALLVAVGGVVVAFLR